MRDEATQILDSTTRVAPAPARKGFPIPGSTRAAPPSFPRDTPPVPTSELNITPSEWEEDDPTSPGRQIYQPGLSPVGTERRKTSGLSGLLNEALELERSQAAQVEDEDADEGRGDAPARDGDEGGSAGEDLGAYDVRLTLAPLWRRALATAIDAAILGGVFWLLFQLGASIAGGTSTNADGFTGLDAFAIRALSMGWVLGLVIALGVALSVAYTTYFAMRLGGRSVGRKLAGIQLVDAAGHPLSPPRAFTRAGLALASFLLFCSGFWLALIDRRGQTLHDKLTRSFVVLPS